MNYIFAIIKLLNPFKREKPPSQMDDKLSTSLLTEAARKELNAHTIDLDMVHNFVNGSQMWQEILMLIEREIDVLKNATLDRATPENLTSFQYTVVGLKRLPIRIKELDMMWHKKNDPKQDLTPKIKEIPNSDEVGYNANITRGGLK